jgi:hypothetical protein
MSEPASDAERPSWIASWIVLAVIGIVIFLIGVALGAISRHPATVRAVATTTVTVVATTPIAVAEPSATGGSFGDGLYQVGVDIPAGNYHTDGGPSCYWERLNNLSGGFTGIISNGQPTVPTTVRVLASDKAFSVHGGCLWAAVP